MLKMMVCRGLTDKHYRYLCSRRRAGGSSLIRHPKAILSIKAFVTDLHIRISAYEIHCCQEI